MEQLRLIRRTTGTKGEATEVSYQPTVADRSGRLLLQNFKERLLDAGAKVRRFSHSRNSCPAQGGSLSLRLHGLTSRLHGICNRKIRFYRPEREENFLLSRGKCSSLEKVE